MTTVAKSWKPSERFAEEERGVRADGCLVDKIEYYNNLEIHPLERKWLLEKLITKWYEKLYNQYLYQKNLKFDITDRYFMQNWINYGFTLDIKKVKAYINTIVQ